MTENYGICLVGVMDRLWFHHIILLPEPHSLPSSPTPKNTSLLKSESSPHLSDNNCQTLLIPEEEVSPATSALPPQQDECNNNNNHQESGIRTPPFQKERPTRLNLLASKTRSHSSSPSVQKRHPKHLKKTMSCKTLRELEVEEVKGFMDLGFTFSKQHLTKRIMRLIPGLRRLEEEQEEEYKDKEEKEKLLLSSEDNKTERKGEDDEDEEEKGCADKIRPYLSEAWLINRPDSPLLNLRVPRASAAADMKKHLKYWARTVATVIHQES